MGNAGPGAHQAPLDETSLGLRLKARSPRWLVFSPPPCGCGTTIPPQSPSAGQQQSWALTPPAVDHVGSCPPRGQRAGLYRGAGWRGLSGDLPSSLWEQAPGRGDGRGQAQRAGPGDSLQNKEPAEFSSKVNQRPKKGQEVHRVMCCQPQTRCPNPPSRL